MFVRASLFVLTLILLGSGGSSVRAEAIAPIQFQLPTDDELPVDRVGTDTRGSLRFTPAVKSAPGNRTAAGTRGSLRFTPVVKGAPGNRTAAGTRGSLRFTPVVKGAPGNRTAAGTRGSLRFTPVVKSAPGNRRASGTRGFWDLLGNAADVNGDSEILSQFLAPDGDPSTLLPETLGVRELLRDSESNVVATEVQDNRGAVIAPELAIALPDSTPLELIPLVVEDSLGRTVSGHPTFYVYVPPTASEQVFFSLQTSDQQDHYQAIIPIAVTGGIVAITLPDTAPELALDQDYQWFFALIEPDGILRPDNYGVQGWIRRVTAPADLGDSGDLLAQAGQYAEAGIWYDMLHNLALYRQETNQNEAAVGEWRDLLNQVGLGAIAEQPLLAESN